MKTRITSLEYAKACAECSAIQAFWKERPWLENGTGPMHTNITIGDLLWLRGGKRPHGEAQVGVIDSVVSVVAGTIKGDRTPYEKPHTGSHRFWGAEYGFNGDIGGHFRRKNHEDLLNNHFLWLPRLDQTAILAGWDWGKPIERDPHLFMLARAEKVLTENRP